MAKRKKNQIPPAIIASEEEDVAPLDLDLNFDTGEFSEDLKSIDFGSAAQGPDDEKSASTLLLDNAPEFPPEIPLFVPLDEPDDVKETKVSFGAGNFSPRPNTPPPQHRSHLIPEASQRSEAASLKQSEHLRIAQNKINELEEAIENLRRENDSLASAGETFKRINDEYYTTIEVFKKKLTDNRKMSGEELSLLKKMNSDKDRQVIELKRLNDDLQSRLDNNFSGVRKREKDLEHRLEIAKIEEAAVIKSKDQLILDLKRRIDRIQVESENFRQKSQENYKELQKKNQVIRGVMRALRLALTKLEGDDSGAAGLESLSSLPSDLKKSG